MGDYNYYEYHDREEYRDPYTQAPYGSNGPDHQKQNKPKKEHKFLKTLGKTAAIALVFGLVTGTVFSGTTHVVGHLLGDDKTEIAAEAPQGRIGEDKEEVTLPKDQNVTAQEPQESDRVSSVSTMPDVSAIAQEVMPSIVQVTNISVVEYRNWFGYGQYEREGAGSGIIISEDDDYLYIATNNHVVANAKTLTITFDDGAAVSAELQGTLPSSDLAVVKVKLSDIEASTLSSIKVARLGSSDDLTVGEGAVVIGNALGYGQSVTTGIISALDREVTLQDDEGRTFTNYLIQTDAAVNPGNSGGALINMNGEVVGIVSAKYKSTDVEGMGYAIPITQASEILTGLVTKQDNDKGDDIAADLGSGAYFGIAGVDVTSDMAKKYDMPEGIYIAQIKDGGGARDAGLTKGDVIVGIDDDEVLTMEELSNLVNSHQPGDVIRVTYKSAESNYNSTVSVDLTLGTKPQEIR